MLYSLPFHPPAGKPTTHLPLICLPGLIIQTWLVGWVVWCVHGIYLRFCLVALGLGVCCSVGCAKYDDDDDDDVVCMSPSSSSSAAAAACAALEF